MGHSGLRSGAPVKRIARHRRGFRFVLGLGEAWKKGWSWRSHGDGVGEKGRERERERERESSPESHAQKDRRIKRRGGS